MGRTPCCEKSGLKKGPWTHEEDQKLLAYIQEHGHGSWRALPAKAGLQRCGKSCRLRWINYLRPDIKRGKFSLQEEQTIIQLHALLGNRWSAIATHLPKRTDNEIKNYWNTHLKKRLTKMGIDPVTHKPKILALGSEQAKDNADLHHMAQWENARLEAEARLVRESKFASYPHHLIHSGSARLLNKSQLLPLSRPQPPCLDVLRAWQGMMSYKQSNFNALESPTSTLNFAKNALAPPLPIVGLIDNQAKPVMNFNEHNRPSSGQSLMMEESSRQYDGKIPEPQSEIPKIQIEEIGNVLEVDEMLYQDSYEMEAVMDLLVDNADTGNYCGILEENKDYWNGILNNLMDF